MKVRTLLIAALLVGAFVYVTSVRRSPFGLFRPESGRIWSGPGVAQSASLSSDEQNNIEIYKSSHTATVNITSTVYRDMGRMGLSTGGFRYKDVEKSPIHPGCYETQS